VNVHSPQQLFFEPLKHLNFADPDLAFPSYAYSNTDPASKNNADQDPDAQPCPSLCYRVPNRTVLQRCGSGMLIPNPEFFPSRTLDPESKNNKKEGGGGK
jgi:hypothetical protein